MGKKYWKCSGCGSVMFKKETTRQLVEMGAGVSGGETCAECHTRHDAKDIYSGKFDFTCDESLIDQMIADPENAQGDAQTKTWTYKGQVIE